MVLLVGKKFQCGECKFFYREKAVAEKCEAWCREHNSCNLEIIQFSLKNGLKKQSE